MTNNLIIHNVREITLSEIRDLNNSFSMNITIKHNILYKNDSEQTDFDITLFANKRKSLEKINFFIPINQVKSYAKNLKI